MQFPRIHLNGSSADGLKAPIREAYSAIGMAIEKMTAVSPHNRDYYVISADAGNVAHAEHRERVQKLTDVRRDLETIYLEIERQESEREKLRGR